MTTLKHFLAERRRIMDAATSGPWQAIKDGKRSNLLPNYNVESCEMQDVGGDPVLICESLKGKNVSAVVDARNCMDLLLRIIEMQDEALKGYEGEYGRHAGETRAQVAEMLRGKV